MKRPPITSLVLSWPGRALAASVSSARLKPHQHLPSGYTNLDVGGWTSHIDTCQVLRLLPTSLAKKSQIQLNAGLRVRLVPELGTSGMHDDSHV